MPRPTDKASKSKGAEKSAEKRRMVERSQICHYDEEEGVYVLITVPAHTAHFTKHDMDVLPDAEGNCPEPDVDVEEPVDVVVPVEEL